MNEHDNTGQQPVIGWQVRTFMLLWSAYASYYLCRLNFAVAQPEILKEFPNWTLAQIGAIPSMFAAVYAIGQFFNGQLAERFGARAMMTVSLLVAGVSNLLFSQANSYLEMLIYWGVNGWVQSAGWSLVVATMANWTPVKRRGIVIGLISTCYQVGHVASWLLAGYLVTEIGWRAAFWVPGLWLLPMAAIFAFFIRNRPEDAGFDPIREDQSTVSANGASVSVDRLTAAQVLKMTLTNRVLWILSIAFFSANGVRYAFMNWSVTYMANFHGQSIENSAFMAVALPLIGSAGAIFAGWASDAWFGGRRAPLSALMLLGLALVCVGFVWVPKGDWVMGTVLLGVSGFMIYGPDMLMSGAATVDFSHPRAAAAATGLTMSAGSAGTIFSGFGVGWILDLSNGSWNVVFYVLAGLSVIPALMMVSLWNVRPKGR